VFGVLLGHQACLMSCRLTLHAEQSGITAGTFLAYR
jgi:hypothetical protein